MIDEGAMAMILGGLEAGGTKMVCTLGNEAGEIMERLVVSTTTPADTMPQILAFFEGKGIAALGIGSFGPVDLAKDSPYWGHITTTPKLPWRFYDIAGTLSKGLEVPIGFDTDVNVAALGEAKRGAARDVDSCVYFTVGTGIGAGIFIDGHLLHGLVHPEFGHVPLRPHPKDPTPEGFCPYHTGCLEALATGPSLQKRWGVPGYELPQDHVAWEIEAYYLAQACITAILVVSPKRIVLGGGVMHQPQLLPMIRQQVQTLLGGYVQHEMILSKIDRYIVSPGLGDNAGSVGALLLGLAALEQVQ